MQGIPLADFLDRTVHCILGLPFDEIDMQGAIHRIQNAAVNRDPCFLSTPNVNWIAGCLADEAFRNSVIRSHLSIADGMPLVWIAKLLRVPIYGRLAGSDLFEMLRHETKASLSMFFFGGQNGVAEEACKKLNAEQGGLKCVGYECPGFGTIEDMSSDECIAKINASEADFVVVALGAKKGQAWIERNRSRLTAPIISHLGAVVDFVAGRVNRAPPWVQDTGFEWLWRIKEDTSLSSRYYSDGLAFFRLFATRVLPFACFIWGHRLGLRGSARQEILQDEASDTLIRLKGAFPSKSLGKLREALSKASLGNKHLRLEMAGVTYLDTELVGLLLQLSGYQGEHEKSLYITTASPIVRRVIKYCCAEYLLGIEFGQDIDS
jgi:N-acetylglucosaminyldiphosphoundecaprenol N-acetyl-beta-D-mannosaminyltransferase